MTHRTAAVTCVALLVAGGGAGTVLAAAASGTEGRPAAPAVGAQAPTLVRVDLAWRERQRSFAYTDVAPRTRVGRSGLPRRFTPGDGFVSSKWVLDDRRRRIGRVEERCTITNAGRDPGAVRSVCAAVILLADGELHASLSPDFDGAERVAAVTGGTGAYAGATGTVGGTEGDPIVRASLVLPRP